MKRCYEIANLLFEINTDLKYHESDNFKEFLVNNSNDRLDKIYCNIFYIDEIEKSKLDNISNLPMINSYEDNLYYRYEFLKSPNGEIYAYTNFNKKNLNYIEIFIKKDCNNVNNTIEIFKLLMLDKLFSLNNIILLHSSYIKYKNKAILFTAPSGTGKSTQADLWSKYEYAEIINGDKTAMQKVDGRWYAYGLPYAGSSDIFKNISTQISTIVVLRKGNENKIKKLSLKEAFKYIYSETIINTWDEQFVNTAIDIILGIINDIPVYLLSCLPNQDAVELLKSEIGGVLI
ncbi:MAG: hypothetical protein KH083_00265 [Intestinibacter bartlettii]|uniref:hypothetical protein n=1 Tax=Intestinibacter bartlettii TaxID=261299 RepID=UPI00242BEA89|nr:hypothetical protein [Intestinibacter bartlettii]MBS7146810.1 hypothetical protein [Intestinibacter bartlettii]